MERPDISCALFEITDSIAAAPPDLGEAVVGLKVTPTGHLEVQGLTGLADIRDHDAVLVTAPASTGDGDSGAAVRVTVTLGADGRVIARLGLSGRDRRRSPR